MAEVGKSIAHGVDYYRDVNWRLLLALLLIWIAWAAIITSVMAATGFNATFTAMALVFAVVALVLILVARKLTTEWYRYFTIMAGVYTVISLLRAGFDRNIAGEQIAIAVMCGISCIALELGRRIRD